MSCKVAEITKTAALIGMQQFAHCVEEKVATHGIHHLDECREEAIAFQMSRELYLAANAICEFFKDNPILGELLQDPEDPFPDWPWPWPPDWSAGSTKQLMSRIKVLEDVVFVLTDIISQPDVVQTGIGSLLSDTEIHLEAVTRVQGMIDGAASDIAAKVERLSQL